MSDAPTTPSLTTSHRWALVAVASLAMALSFLERQTLSVLAPTVTKALGLSNAQYGWASSAFALAILAATPLSGFLLDRFGVRRGLFFTVLLWSLVSAAHGLAAGFGSLLLLRVLLGLTESPTTPGALHVVRSALPPADVPRGIGLALTGPTLGFVGALFVAVALEQRFGWRSAFVGVAAVSAAWLPLWAALTWGPKARQILEPPRGPSVSAWSALSHPAVVRAVVFTFSMAPLIAFFSHWWVKFLAERFALPQADLASYGFLAPVAYDVGAIVFGDLASRARRRGGLRLEEALLAFGCLLAAANALTSLQSSPWFAVLVGSIGAFGAGGAFALCNAGALSAVPGGQVSRAAAMIATSFQLGSVIANPLIGWSIDRTGSYTLALAVPPLLIVPGAAIWLLLGRRARRKG